MAKGIHDKLFRPFKQLPLYERVLFTHTHTHKETVRLLLLFLIGKYRVTRARSFKIMSKGQFFLREWEVIVKNIPPTICV